jgi:aryl-alcohol dehydrogenase-like predicted oxidoreductase
MLRKLGPHGLQAAPIGYGAMVLEGYYGAVDEAAAVSTIQRAIDLGATLIDTADAYGGGRNEALVGRALRGRRDEVVVATKFGIVFDDTPATVLSTGWGTKLPICGSPEYARKCLDRSLKALGVDHVDLWYTHYLEPGRPVEETAAAMAEAVKAGKVRYLGLCNVNAEEIRRAHSAAPISVVQNEYSLWRREAESEVFPVLHGLGIGFVAWSPLGAGFLAGTTEVGADDFRSNNPRFSGEHRTRNEERFAPLREVAASLAISPAQLALAWILAQGPDIVPIPGSRNPRRVEENLRAAEVALDPETLARIEAIAPPGAASGPTLM